MLVHPGPVLAGVGSGTLLGPEESAVWWLLVVRVWVARGAGGGRGLGLLVLPLPGVAVWWPMVLVGLLFEICIVDASIFATRCCHRVCRRRGPVC